MSDTPVPTRGFTCKMQDHCTQVDVIDLSDGNTLFTLITEREGMEPMMTALQLCPKTLALLSVAMHRAAHDPSVWKPVAQTDSEAGK